MSRVVTEKEHQFDQEQASQYPWRVWSDGQQRHLEPGVDFDGTREEFEEHVYQHARQNGLKARTELNGTGLYIQFETKTVQTTDEPSGKPPRSSGKPPRSKRRSSKPGRKPDFERTELSDAKISPHIPRFNRQNRPRGGYPWTEWADGQAHKLIKGQHYRNPTENFMVSAYTKAKAMGMRVRSHRTANGVTIQFYG